MKKKALIVYGGWEGHTPAEFAFLIDGRLNEKGFDVQLATTLDVFKDRELLESVDVIIPLWTMGELPQEETECLLCAVGEKGTGIACFHGSGDAFRGNIGYEWMTGGIFVGHPYTGKYNVELTELKSTITEGMPQRFEYESEQYYMMTDPANRILATTVYRHDSEEVTMPVIWIKNFGKARVFYSSLGHCVEEFMRYPDVLEMTLRGIVWASEN